MAVKKILIACEESQTICKAFRRLGFEAYSNDIQDCSGGHPEWHLKMDAFEAVRLEKWDLMIAHPPCTYLSVSGLHWNNRNIERRKLTESALLFVRELMNAPIDYIAIENPVSCISSAIRKPDQIINPYQFGDDAAKKTCLWLKGLPLLLPTKYVEPRIIDGKKRWSNQMDNGQNVTFGENGKMLAWNSDEIKKVRSKTYEGIANAIAEQWSKVI